jgi:transcriptional regulator with XRE-family HTH domain
MNTTTERPMTKDTNGSSFPAALRAERERQGLSQDALGQLVNLTGARISQYETDPAHPPAPDTVFRIEQALDLPGGRLSYHLGFVPVGAIPDVVTALDDDPFLNARGREAVRTVYESVIEQGKKPRR